MVDLKSPHAKIGQLTLKNDFLETGLNQVGLLSAETITALRFVPMSTSL